MKIHLSIKVLCVHIGFIISIFCLLKFKSCDELKEENITHVKLVSFPNRKPKHNLQSATAQKPQTRTPKTKKSSNNSYRSPEAIRNSGFIKLNPPDTSLAKPEDKDVANKINISRIKHELEANFDKIQRQNIDFNTQNIEPEYFQLIINHLYELWDQPSRSEIGNKHLEVKVEFLIINDGSISRKKMITPSTIPAMDNSINKLLGSIKKFPPFPKSLKKNKLTTIITLELT